MQNTNSLSRFIIALFLILPFGSMAQDLTPTEVIEDLIEELASSTDEELDYTTLFDDLYSFYQEPLNLNEASWEELENLHILNEVQIYNLLAYRKNHGDLLTIYELAVIDGFDKQSIEKIMPFVAIETVGETIPFNPKNVLKYGRHQIFLRSQWLIEDQAGFLNTDDTTKTKYRGDKYKYYTRYKFNYKNYVNWGFTTEKDPGEEFFKGEQSNGFDYYTAHLQINKIGVFKKILIGDFQANFGQGLALWSGLGQRKNSYVTNIRRRSGGLRKYSSTNENQFMRGVGTTVSLGNFDLSAFVSKKKVDANVELMDSLGQGALVITFLNSGYHRTESEIKKMDVVYELMYGGNIVYRYNDLQIGLNGFTSRYSIGDEMYKSLGNDLISDEYDYNCFSLDYKFSHKKLNFFGEFALSNNESDKFLNTKAKGFVNGMVFPLVPQVTLAMLHRHYDKDFKSLYGGGFGESSKNEAESGFYVGAEILPYKKWKISAYYDVFRYSWLKHRVNAPSEGNEYFVQIDFAPSRNVKMYCRYKNEEKMQTEQNSEAVMRELDLVKKSNFRYHIAYSITETLGFRNRFEYVKYEKGDGAPEEGYMFYHDIVYKPTKIPLVLYFRYALFETDTYNPRIYAYENDVLYAFSIPAYYYRGSRTYLTLKYSFANKLDLWLRYSQTMFTDRDKISSGLNEIDGNTRSEFKVQMRYRF